MAGLLAGYLEGIVAGKGEEVMDFNWGSFSVGFFACFCLMALLLTIAVAWLNKKDKEKSNE